MELWARLSRRSRLAIVALLVCAAALDLLVVGRPLLSAEMCYIAVALWLAPLVSGDLPVQDLLLRFADRLNAVLSPREERLRR